MWDNISLWFWFEFPGWLMMLSIFSCTRCHLHVFFGKMSIQILCLFFNWSVCFCYWDIWVICIITPYFQIYDLQAFSPIQLITFFVVDGFLCCTKTLVWCSCTYLCLLLALLLVSNPKKSSPRQINVKKLPAYVFF